MIRAAVAVVLLLAVALAACGGGGGASKTATPTRSPSPVPAVSPPASPSPGNTPRIPRTTPVPGITLPSGFSAYAIATGFSHPTSVAVGPDGTTYVAESGGTVYALADSDGDGVFEQLRKVFTTTGTITGLLAAPDGTLFVPSTGKVTALQGDATTDIITGLPHSRHQNNGLVLGPDGKLYLTNGSTCDDCTESDPRSAAILQANADGSNLRVYAHGLRNPYDLTFDDRGRLWATDNGSDTPCATVDELDLIVEGGDYGWPYGAKGCDPNTAGTPPAGNLRLHSAATGITFYNAAHFPAEYRGNLFITLWGGFIPPASAPALVRAVIQPDNTAIVQDFGTGFQHPIDVFVDRDGTLLVLDYGSSSESAEDGVLYRVVYTGR